MIFPNTNPLFSEILLEWFQKHGRKNLPWQHPKDAYRVWVSEIMLQQTQVKTVIPYFNRFIERFPTVQSLAHAHEDDILALWSGLGYYSRARNLHKTAKIITEEFAGVFSKDPYVLANLPGIGLSTASAITSIAFNQPTPILDANVVRVLCRYFLIAEDPAKAKTKEKLWELAHQCMSPKDCAQYTQAIMDFGATCCVPKIPKCNVCPFMESCLAYKNKDLHSYPYKKSKKILPVKNQIFLLIHNAENLIYLEKNPPVGIWGGLWCIPSLDSQQCVHTHLSDNYEVQVEHVKRFVDLKHSFSHFHLQMNVFLVQARLSKNCIKESKGRWVPLPEVLNYGIAKPIRSIIELYQNQMVNHPVLHSEE